MGGRRWWILIALIIGLLPLAADLCLLLPALPATALDLSTSGAHATQLAAALPLGLAVALPLTRKLTGVRRVLLLGLALAVVGCFVELRAQSVGAALAGRLVVAVGAALALRAALGLVHAVFEPAEHRRAVAIWAGFTGLAVAAAPFAGGALADHHHSVFALELPFLVVGLLGIVAILPKVDDPPEEPARSAAELSAPIAVFALLGGLTATVLRLQPDVSATRAGAALVLALLAFAIAARGPVDATAGLLLATLSLAGLAAYEGGPAALLLIPLGAGAALAIGASIGSDPLLRLVAAGLGIGVLGSLDSRPAFLTGAVVSAAGVGADLLGRARRRRRDLAPP